MVAVRPGAAGRTPPNGTTALADLWFFQIPTKVDSRLEPTR